jgi:hypothetical protein
MRKLLQHTRQQWQRIFGKPAPDSIDLVPLRFLQAFHDHGIATSQIPRLFPDLKLEDLQSPASLLSALTPAILDRVARFFGIRSEWLEGNDERIYPYRATYREPAILLGHLGCLHQQHRKVSPFLLRILTTTPRLDKLDSGVQLLAPVLIEPIATLGEEQINRFHIYQDGLDWSYPSARLDLKAIVRVAHDLLHKPIPLIPVDYATMDEILEGRLIPHRLLSGPVITNPSLEDYVMDSHESVVAKETDELPIVLDFIDAHQLRQAFTHPPSPEQNAALEIPASPAAENQPPPADPLPSSATQPGKRGIRAQDWAELKAVAAALWAQDSTIPIADMIRRLKKLPKLRAARLTESAIHKQLRSIAPPEVRGKSGRKPKKSA